MGLRAAFNRVARATRYFRLRHDERTSRLSHHQLYTLDCWWSFALPKAAGTSYRGKVGKPSPIRLSLCPCSDNRVNYNVREQSTLGPSSRYKYLLGTNCKDKELPSINLLPGIAQALPTRQRSESEHQNSDDPGVSDL
jgi:hypothetical protein